MTTPILAVAVRYGNDIVLVRQRTRQVAALLGFDELEQARIATAVSEIARNAYNYAGGGHIEFLIDEGGDRHPLLSILVTDRGPGIADVPGVLAGRIAGGHGRGLGIVSARRLMDDFRIDSAVGKGTRVLLSKRFPKTRTTITPREIARMATDLARRGPEDPLEEVRRHNQDLLRAMEELRVRQEELERLNRELEDTNRGVVALYAELDEKATHLRRADEIKSRFLSNMSHEFRTPLNSILALSRLLLDRSDGQLTAEQEKQIAFIQKSALDLSELVNDLLDLAKVEAGRITVTAGEVRVENLFGGLRGMFRPLVSNPLVALVFRDPVAIPPIYTDEGKVSQILRNFISNALKFTEKGQVVVSAEYDSAEKTVTFSVSDTGIGIAADDQERIFSEFEQVESHIQTRVKGTGLGLPLSRKLAQVLGGSISVRSELGQGSTFYLMIPAAYTSSVGAPAKVDITRHPVLAVSGDREAVLLYDKYLKGTGFQVIAAGNAHEAKRLLPDVRPVAVLLDSALEGGAWELLIGMKRDESTRSIAVYMVGAAEEAQRALALGAAGLLTKPVARKRLLESLREATRTVQSPKVLVIDDDDVSRYILRDLLADTRYQVIEAANGLSGLALAREQKPSVILLDLAMPAMNGHEVLEDLFADDSTAGIPVIIVTSKFLDDRDRALLSSRVVAVLSKESSSRQEAIAKIREALTAAELKNR